MKPVYSSVSNITGPHNGGICTVQIVPKRFINVLPDVNFTDGTITEAVTLIAGASWLTLSLTESSYEYDEKPKTTRGGTYFDISAGGTVNYVDATLLQVLETLRYEEVVAIVKDKKKQLRLVGNKDNGMVFQYTSKSNNAQGGITVITIDLAGTFEQSPAFYSV